FISSVIHNPVLLILDEPFSGFDPVNQELVRQLIAEFVNSGKMIIISTHQMEIAEVLCNKIIVINKGKEILKGSIDQIKLRFKENSFYIGYEGDAEALKNFPMIKILSQSKDRIKVQLKENIDPVELLRKISSEIKVNHFSAAEPTLYDIYLETIKKAS
ncbi:MAG: ABC transporter ATP-binding protein, partial [Bacillota bacterium]